MDNLGTFHLMDLPDEMLLHIFVNLNDTSLLNAIRVCHRFKSIAGEAFAKLYNGSTKEKHFQLNICNENLMTEREQYVPFLSNFGDNIGGISINFKSLRAGATVKPNAAVAGNHWVIFSIQRHCMSLKSIRMRNGEQIDLTNFICFAPKLTHLHLENLKLRYDSWTNYNYPKMKCFTTWREEGISPRSFAAFLVHNRQNLERLAFELPLNQILNNLPAGWFEIANLRELSVKMCKNSFVPFLSAVQNGCKNIEKLTITSGLDDYDDNDGIISMQHISLLCGFCKLKSLNLDNFVVSLSEMQELVERIPTLNDLEFYCAENFGETQESLLTIATLCRKLSQITLITELDFDPSLVQHEFGTQYGNRIGVKSNLKMSIWRPPYTINICRDEVRLNVEENECRILYWKGYDPTLSSNGKTLLELYTEVLLRIVGYLDVSTSTAFFRTCRLTEQLVKQHLQNEILLSTEPTQAIDFETLGEFISRLVIADDRFISKPGKLMDCVAKHCGRNLVEFEIKNFLPVDIDTDIFWPNLLKLKLSSLSIVSYQKLKRFHCPKLTHLEIKNYKNGAIVEVEWNDSFRNITSIQFGSYNESVEKFLFEMTQRIGNQLKALSLMRTSEWFRANTMSGWINLNLIISRCHQLENLHLHLSGLEESNYKYVFENCSALVELTVLFDSTGKIYASYYENLFDMLNAIKKTCKYLQTVNLVRDSADAKIPLQFYSLFPKTNVT